MDLELATRAEHDLAGLDPASVIGRMPFKHALPRGTRDSWIVGVLGTRGIRVDLALVRSVLEGAPDPRCSRQERVFIGGLDRALDRILDRGQAGRLPDGAFLVELFATVTRGLPRFTNNHLRRDLPWDALRHVSYPKPNTIGDLLDRMTPELSYRDMPAVWDRTHPVRRAFRVMWRFARIAPFPDFNLMFAYLLMNAFHVSAGYPLMLPEPSDRALLESVVAGGVPRRIVQFESRLLAAAS